MKKGLFILCLMLTSIINAQSVEEDYTDDFNERGVVKTSWKKMFYNTSETGYYRFSKVNDLICLDVKLKLVNKYFSIDNDKLMVFKFEDGTIFKLYNRSYVKTETRDDSKELKRNSKSEITTAYVFDYKDLSILKTKKVIMVRVYTDDGCFDNELKDRFGKALRESAKLIM